MGCVQFFEFPDRRYPIRLFTLISAFSILLCISTTARSSTEDTEKSPRSSVLSLEELRSVVVTTASKLEEKIQDTPGTVIVVTREQIQQLGYSNLIQLLRELPGFIVHQYSSETNYATITHRGFVGSNKFLILQDGIRITDPAGSPTPVNDNVPLFHVKQVEVVYGPVSALYGADAFTGIINIITQDAQAIDGLEITATGEIDADYNRISLQFGKQLGDNIAFVAGGHVHEAENPDLSETYNEEFTLDDLTTFDGTVVVPKENRQGYYGETQSYSFYSKLQLGKQLTIGGQRSYFQHPTSSGSRSDTADFGTDRNWNTLLGSIYGKFKQIINDQTMLLLQASHAYYEVRNDSKFVNIFTDFQEGFKYARSESDQFEIQVDHELNSDNNIIGGFNYTDYYALPKTTDLGSPYNTDEGSSTQSQYYTGTDDNLQIKFSEVRYDVVAGFLQWRRQWNNQWLSTVGVRYDDSSTFGKTFNPRIGLVYQLSEKTTVKLLYGSAFLAPAPLLSYEQFGAFSGDTDGNGLYNSSFFQIPNPDLQPEKIDTYELYLSHRLTGNLQWTVIPYFNSASDLIFGAPADPQQPSFIDGGEIAFTNFNDNIGDGKSYGIDTWIDYVKIFDSIRLKLTASYSYLDSELEIDGQNFTTPLPGTAHHSLKMIAVFNWRDKYTLSPRVLWQDKTYSNKADPSAPSNLLTSRSYSVVNLHADAKIHQRVSLTLDIDNLFNRKYYGIGSTSSAGFIESPQDPRRVYLGIRYQL